MPAGSIRPLDLKASPAGVRGKDVVCQFLGPLIRSFARSTSSLSLSTSCQSRLQVETQMRPMSLTVGTGVQLALLSIPFLSAFLDPPNFL